MSDVDPSLPLGSADPEPPVFAQPLGAETAASSQSPESDAVARAPETPAPSDLQSADFTSDAGQGVPESAPEMVVPPAAAVTEPAVADSPAMVSDSVAVDPVAGPPEALRDGGQKKTAEAVVTGDVPTEPVGEPSAVADDPIAEAEIAPASMFEFSLRLADLETAVRESARRDESGRAAINALHSELGDYKDDFLVRAQAPMLRALVRLLDDVDEMARSDRPVRNEDVAFLGDQVVEILESYGAEEVSEQPEVVDGAFQKVLRTEPTDDPARHRRVAAILRRGWRAHGRLLRPQNVSVYVFTESEAEQAACDAEAAPASTSDVSTEPAPEVETAPAVAETVSTTVEASVPRGVRAEPTQEPTTEAGNVPAVEEESTNV